MKPKLVIPIKPKWLAMIEIGEKKEEYRELTPYWNVRLSKLVPGDIIEYRAGYGLKVPSLQVRFISLSVGLPNPKWTDNHKVCFRTEIELLK